VGGEFANLYVILSGAVEVTADGKRLNTLGAGGFFGELAAIVLGCRVRPNSLGHGHAGPRRRGCSCSIGCSSTG
jgi:CRP-like cAMP-binding protein